MSNTKPLNEHDLQVEKPNDSTHKTIDANTKREDVSEAHCASTDVVDCTVANVTPSEETLANNKVTELLQDNTAFAFSKTVPLTDTKVETELHENIISAKALPLLTDTKPKNEGEISSDKMSDNLLTSEHTKPVEVDGKERDLDENSCNEKRKRKSKHLNLHATFKRPKLTSDEELSQTIHYFENGLRKLVPYDFKYNTFCKGTYSVTYIILLLFCGDAPYGISAPVTAHETALLSPGDYHICSLDAR